MTTRPPSWRRPQSSLSRSPGSWWLAGDAAERRLVGARRRRRGLRRIRRAGRAVRRGDVPGLHQARRRLDVPRQPRPRDGARAEPRRARAVLVSRDAPAASGEGISARRGDACRRRPRVVGGDSLWLYHPCVAFTAAMLALALYGLLGSLVGRPWLRGARRLRRRPVGAALRLCALGRLEGGRRGGGDRPGVCARVARATERSSPRAFLPLAVACAWLLGVLSSGAVLWLAAGSRGGDRRHAAHVARP